MGDSSGDLNTGDGEVPVHVVEVTGFEIDATTVANEAFAAFTKATDYVTEAEVFGFSAVFHLTVAAPADDVMGSYPQTPWWLGVRGANWRHPGGSLSSIEGRGDHPVVHVSHNDAVAYCAWAGRALPTEAQWERAARGGLESMRYPWGDAEPHVGGSRANIWQGEFPARNTREDGYLTTGQFARIHRTASGFGKQSGMCGSGVPIGSMMTTTNQRLPPIRQVPYQAISEFYAAEASSVTRHTATAIATQRGRGTRPTPPWRTPDLGPSHALNRHDGAKDTARLRSFRVARTRIAEGR